MKKGCQGLDPTEASPLCVECRTFLASPGYAEKPQPKGSNSWLVSDKFSRSPAVIFKSADDGCHLCSLVAWEMLFPVRLAYKGGKEKIQEQGSIFLALQRSVYDKELKLQVSYAPPTAAIATGCIKPNVSETKAAFFTLNLFTIIPYAAAKSTLRHVQLPLSTGTGSEASLKIAKGWINECTKEHLRCAQHKTERTFPTRVIDLGDGPSIQPKVLEASMISTELVYATLSYCWGSPETQHLRLLTTNYEALQKGIDVRSLPLTLHDGMIACQGLGVRYLWIDRLCIMQDSPEDWGREAAKMAKVFENALFSISASAAADSAQGFFRDRDPLSSFTRPCLTKIRLVTDREADPDEYYYCIPYLQWSRDIEDAPLADRGWVVQERFLSPRILYFGRRQLVWECREKRASECIPAGVSLPRDDWEQQKYTNHHSEGDVYRLMLQILGVSWPANTANIRNQFEAPEELWRNIIALYSKRKLTFVSDKLVAVQGIATWLQASTADEYLAGLWRKHLPVDLMWRSESGNIRSCEYRAPSWSWASTNGSVTWWGKNQDIERQHMLSVEDASLKYDDVGSLQRGSIRCVGRLYKGVLKNSTLILGKIICWGQADAPGPFQATHTCGYHIDATNVPISAAHYEVYCAPLYQHYRAGVSGAISGLLLIPTGEGGQYRRLGWFMSEDHRIGSLPDSSRIAMKAQLLSSSLEESKTNSENLSNSRPEHESFFFPRRKPQWPPKGSEETQKLDSDLREQLQISGPEERLAADPVPQLTCQQSLFAPRILGLAERREVYQRATRAETWPLEAGVEYEEFVTSDADGAHWFKYTII